MQIVLIVVAAGLLVQASIVPSDSGGQFSKKATPIWDQIWDKKRMRIPAPDGNKIIAVQAEGNGLILHLLTGKGQFPIELGEWVVGAEAAWSPDSKAFFITASEGGRVGLYNTFVFLPREDRLDKIDFNARIEKAFGNPVVCSWPEPPNVVAVAWLGSSERLLVAAQILPHSVCDSFGTFKAYEVSVLQGTILREYDQLEAKRRFRRHLGWDLRAANDECIRTPKSCEVPANHPAPKN